MNVPSVKDRIVSVTAYLTNDVFGYDHWRAAQFSAPDAETSCPAVLVICRDEADRARIILALAGAPIPEA